MKEDKRSLQHIVTLCVGMIETLHADMPNDTRATKLASELWRFAWNVTHEGEDMVKESVPLP